MISLCVTNYNREELLYKSIEQVIDDEAVSDIVILDDCSQIEIYDRIKKHYAKYDKVRVLRNDTNMDCYRSKRRAISLAKNEWCIILDSDNIIDKSYIDHVFEVVKWDTKLIIQPSFAYPHFDFRAYSGLTITRHNVADHMGLKMFETMLNAMNYFVNRDEYLRVWDSSVDPVTSDSIYQNYRWLSAGNAIHIADGLEYFHRVDDHGKEEESHYIKKNKLTRHGFHDDIILKLKRMK